MYRYQLNDVLSEVQAIYFDGTAFGVNRIKDFITNTDAQDFIEDVTITLTVDANEDTICGAARGQIATIVFKPDVDVSNLLYENKLFPGDTLIIRRISIREPGPSRLIIASMPASTFGALYKSSEA